MDCAKSKHLYGRHAPIDGGRRVLDRREEPRPRARRRCRECHRRRLDSPQGKCPCAVCVSMACAWLRPDRGEAFCPRAQAPPCRCERVCALWGERTQSQLQAASQGLDCRVPAARRQARSRPLGAGPLSGDHGARASLWAAWVCAGCSPSRPGCAPARQRQARGGRSLAMACAFDPSRAQLAVGEIAESSAYGSACGASTGGGYADRNCG